VEKTLDLLRCRRSLRKPHRREPLEEEDDAEDAVDEDDEERDAALLPYPAA
jgi:hypothetical protein